MADDGTPAASSTVPVPTNTGLAPFTRIEKVESTKALLDLLRDGASDLYPWRFLYRGQPDSSWGLQPSIERIERSAPWSNLSVIESYIGAAFKRRARHYLPAPPPDDDDLAWLALMRHHGAPSRLLDWTRSPYVGLGFAAFGAGTGKEFALWRVEEAFFESMLRQTFLWLPPLPPLPPGGIGGDLVMEFPPAGVDFEPLRKQGWQEFLSLAPNFAACFLDSRPTVVPVVAPVEPYETSERMAIQQGLFLCANTLSFTFEHCLATMLSRAGAPPQSLVKIEIAPNVRVPLLAELAKMNISEATLFPGLDGFARSLRNEAEIPGRSNAGLPDTPISPLHKAPRPRK